MKNILNTIKYIPIFVLVIFLFSPAKQSFAVTCWTNYGPEWMNCNYGNNDNDDDDNDDDDNDNDSDNLNVSTLSATNIDDDSATLRGDITDLDESEDYERYFEWGTDDDDLDRTTYVSGTTDNEGSFSKTITGLTDDRTYYYRACAEEDNGGDEDCGSIRSFRTDEDNSSNDNDDNDNDNDNNNGDDSVLTTDATFVTSTSATLNGVVINDGGSQRVWFEYGSTTNLGNKTSSKTVYGDQNIVSIDLNGLNPSQAYFFRLVSSTGEKGDIRSLFTKSITATTGGGTNPNPTPTDRPTVTVNSGEYLNVDLISNVNEARAGEAVVYEVVYENLTTKTLKSIRILIDFPEGITPKKTDLGTFLSRQEIEVVIPNLSAKTKGHFTVVAEVDRSVSNGEFLVSVIEANYDHPITPNTTINTVDYSILKVFGGNTDQAASAFLALGLLGISFWGWLIILLLIALIIWFAHKLSKENKKAKEDELKKELQISK